MKTISKKLTKKTLDMITELAKDEEKYKLFWRYYSKNIKMGLIED
jgi:HSP90 family molecular chaperone